MSVVGLYGREAETRALDDALDLLAAGRRPIVLIEGEAGIGKTRLLAEILDRARDRGFEVARGQGQELERSRPFGLAADAFGCVSSSRDPRRRAIAALLAVPGGRDGPPITVTSDPSLQFRAVDAFIDLAEDVALRAPLMIGLDDLQWADPSSVLTIGALARRLGDLPVGLVGCFRPLPHASQLQRLLAALDAAGARHLTLGPLPEAAVSDLVAESVAAEPGPGLLAETARAGGNPLFVTELVDAIKRVGGVMVTGGQADVAERSLPATLRVTILRRLSFLGEESLQTLRVASILGSSFSLTDLSIVTDRPALDVSVTLAKAVSAGVASDDGARLRFRHDLIRDAIYEELPGSVRLALHREAGQRLAAHGAPAQQVAEQLARGAMPGQAVEWLIRAGREAASTSPAAAASLLERAIALMPPTDPGRNRVLTERAASLLWSGRVSDAAQACHALLNRSHDPAVEGAARMCLGHALLAAGRAGDALDEFEGGAEVTETERANALGWAGLARLWLGDLDGAASLAERARSAASAAGDPLATSIALGCLAAVTTSRGHLREAGRLIDDAVRLADQTPGWHGHRYPLHADRGGILSELDRFDEAAATLRAGRRICEELGVGWHLLSYQTTGAVQRFIVGAWDDAIAEIEAGLELAHEMGVTHSLALSYGVLSLIKLHRNDIAGAQRAAETAAGDLAATGPRYRSRWALWARALALEADGRPGDAFAALARLWDECAAIGSVIEYRILGPDLVRLALAEGDQRRARQVASAVARLAEENDVPSLTGAALRCRGLADRDPITLAAAVDAYASARRPLELAQACEDAGVGLAREASPDRGRQFIARALDIYEGLDATRDVLRAEAALRDLGVRRGRRRARARPETGWDSLTPSERAVADHVAQGLSNPQVGERLYVSRRTVQTHLAHIFAKLDISSRAQLAAEVARHH